MIIRWLRLKNIRSYMDENIEFPEGSVMLGGDIGSGKSSILLSIEFALFGLKRGELSGEALLRNGEKQGYVEMCLDFEGKSVIIKRTLKRSKESVKQENGYIVIDAVKEDLTPVEMKAKIFSLLGYPLGLVSKSKDAVFRFTVYTPQEMMKHILNESPEIRLDTLRRVFSIDKYKKVKEALVVYSREIKRRKSELKGFVVDLEDKKNQHELRIKEAKEAEDKMVPIKCKLIESSEKIVAIEEEICSKEKELSELRKMKEELFGLESSLSEKIRNLSRLSERIKRLDDDLFETKKKLGSLDIKDRGINEEELEKEIESLQKRRDGTKNRMDSLISSIQMINKSLANFEDEDLSGILSSKEKELKHIEEEISGLKEELADSKALEEKIMSVRDKISKDSALLIKLNETSEKISGMNSCPLCLQKVDHEHKKSIIKTNNSESSKLKEDRSLLKEEESKLLKEKDRYDQASKELIDKDKLVAKVSSEIKSLKERSDYIIKKTESMKEQSLEKEAMEKELSELKKVDISVLEKEIIDKKGLLAKVREEKRKLIEKKALEEKLQKEKKEFLELEEEQKQLKKEIGDINKKKILLSSRSKALLEAEKIFSESKERLAKLTKERGMHEVSLASLAKERESSLKYADEIMIEIEEKEKSLIRIKKYDSYVSWMEESLSPIVSLIEKSVMVKVHKEFDGLFQRWLGTLLEDENIMATLSEDFTPIVTQNGYNMDFSNLSGGERQSVSLAYRLALNQVLNNLIDSIKTKDIIILDEPTDGFSTEQLDKIRDVLEELTIKQVIIVSHEDKIESFVENVIRVDKKEHESRVF